MYTPIAIYKQGAFDNDVNAQLNQNALNATLSLGAGPLSAIAASGAINPNASGAYIITKAGVAAMTIAAPLAGAPQYTSAGVNLGGNDGTVLIIVSNTAYAHTVTATGLYQDGAGHVNLATFPADAGASIVLQAYGAKWNVLGNNNVTFS
jgi:hypothetical protein